MSAPLAPDRGFGVYIHWPYCARICPYCDFNVYKARPVDEGAWVKALTDDLAAHRALTGPRTLGSIFFGGGTPSLMSPEAVGDLIEAAARLWTPADDIEISLEANPTSAERQRFEGFAAAGVNRVSLGVQSFDDAALKALGRDHSAAEAVAAAETARRVFPRMSLDLIYARPDQGAAAWRDELARGLALAGDHLSLYQLTIEPGTAFAKAAARGALIPPDEASAADLYELTQELCAAADFPAYETSNHARAGGASRHNLIYWRMGDYVGVGPGAHGRMTREGRRFAAEAVRRPEDYLAKVSAQGVGGEETELTAAEDAAERLLMGLRLAEGAKLRPILERRGVSADAPAVVDALGEIEAAELGDFDSDGRLRLSGAGRLLVDAVARRLIRALDTADAH
ncbi:MAG: radical SAM family heme chaperone HemW [Pseudomonadota bacterium]